MSDTADHSSSADGNEQMRSTHLESEEAEARLGKLRLEQRALRRQMSIHGTLLEWFKAASVPATLIGVLVTFFTQTETIKQTQTGRDSERFDKAIARLGAPELTERLSGVSGVRLFLAPDESARHAAALLFLVNTLSTEQEPLIQASVLDAFREANNNGVNKDAMRQALQSAVEKNRTLTRAAKEAVERVQIEFEHERITSILHLDPKALPTHSARAPKSVLEKIPWDQRMNLYPQRGAEQNIEHRYKKPLAGLRDLIDEVIQFGVTVSDFSGITCERCNFTALGLQLDNANFDGADLSSANFANKSLRGSSFKNSKLGGTNFYNANLDGADLSGRARVGIPGTYFAFPRLMCARLSNANLSGRPLMLIAKETSVDGKRVKTELRSYSPNLQGTIFDSSTKAQNFAVIVVTRYPMAVLRVNTQARQNVVDDLPEVPIGEGSYYSAEFRSERADYVSSADIEQYSGIVYSQVVALGDEIRLTDKAVKIISDFLKENELHKAKIPSLRTAKGEIVIDFEKTPSAANANAQPNSLCTGEAPRGFLEYVTMRTY